MKMKNGKKNIVEEKINKYQWSFTRDFIFDVEAKIEKIPSMRPMQKSLWQRNKHHIKQQWQNVFGSEASFHPLKVSSAPCDAYKKVRTRSSFQEHPLWHGTTARNIKKVRAQEEDDFDDR